MLARDVPTCVFFQSWPNAVAGTECFDKASAEDQRRMVRERMSWEPRLLVSMSVGPKFDLTMAYALGDDVRVPVGGYLKAIRATDFLRVVGWSDEGLRLIESVPDAPGDVAAAMTSRARGYSLRDHVLPHIATADRNIKMVVMRLAKAAGVRPSDIWHGPISAFMLDASFHADELRGDGQRGGGVPEEVAAAGIDG